jgi:predicted enzyme related to lactoylglutathione lyase
MVKLDHLRLGVNDWQLSRDWYVGNFGLKVEFEISYGGSNKLGVAALQDDAGFTLFLEQIPQAVHGCDCICYFQVTNVDEQYRSLNSEGIRFLDIPQKFFWGYGAELADPDGHIIRIWDEKSMKAK